MRLATGLKGLSPEQFLKRYWQKKPLFMRGVFSSLEVFSREMLQDLSTDPSVTSRIVTRSGKSKWELEQGPFPRKSFAKRGTKDWTLLVQEVNTHVRLGQQIMDLYSFIPSWRTDDLMVSFATPGGSVGPHTDKYDVFLIQAFGRRRWQIAKSDHFECIPGLDLKVIKNFRPQKTFISGPGDVLYLPPGIAHFGEAIDDCATLSVGFRAPSAVGLIDAAFSAVEGEGPLLADPGRMRSKNSAEVTSRDFHDMGELMGSLFLEPNVQNAVLDALTAPKRGGEMPIKHISYSRQTCRQRLRGCRAIARRTIQKLAFKREGSRLYVSVAGRGFLTRTAQEASLIEMIGQKTHLNSDTVRRLVLDPKALDTLILLLDAGVVAFED